MNPHTLLLAATVFSVTVLLSTVLTWCARAVAPRCGLVDKPDNRRKLHGKAIPLGGGVAIFVTTVLVLGGLFVLQTPWRHVLWGCEPDKTWALLAAGAVIVAVGLVDDRIALRGRVKLLGQIAAVLILVLAGQRIERIAAFGYEIDLGLLAIPFTLFWLLGAINALNLLDGIDGLTSTLGLIMVVTIGVMAQALHHEPVPTVALVFASSLVGFLVFNFPPASIFLGDAGSMLIGLMVGSLAIRGALKGPGTVLLAAPLAVWTIPIFDSLAAILRRKLTGRSIYATDRGHMHHRLLTLLGSNRKALLSIATFCLLTSAATVLSVSLQSDLIAMLSCAAIVIILIATGVFGRAEMMLLADRVRSFGNSLLEPSRLRHKAHQSSVRLQGHRPWETLWASLIESVEKLSLAEIRLDVNLARSHENFHACWQRPGGERDDRQWRLELPLVAAEQPVGRLLLMGHRGGSVCEDLEGVVALLESFETRFQALAGEEPAAVFSARVRAAEPGTEPDLRPPRPR